MVLNDLIPSLIDYAREVVNDLHSHFSNRVDGLEDKVGYVVTERTSHLVASDSSQVFDQVDSRRSICAGGCIPQWRSVHIANGRIRQMAGIQAYDPTAEHLKLLTNFPPSRFKQVID